MRRFERVGSRPCRGSSPRTRSGSRRRPRSTPSAAALRRHPSIAFIDPGRRSPRSVARRAARRSASAGGASGWRPATTKSATRRGADRRAAVLRAASSRSTTLRTTRRPASPACGSRPVRTIFRASRPRSATPCARSAGAREHAALDHRLAVGAQPAAAPEVADHVPVQRGLVRAAGLGIGARRARGGSCRRSSRRTGSRRRRDRCRSSCRSRSRRGGAPRRRWRASPAARRRRGRRAPRRRRPRGTRARCRDLDAARARRDVEAHRRPRRTSPAAR